MVPAAGQSTAPPPPVENALQLDRFQKPWPDRFVYIARAKRLHEFEDADEDKQKSPIILYEDDKPLDLPTATTPTSNGLVRAGTPISRTRES